jgi:hypothetical protein
VSQLYDTIDKKFWDPATDTRRPKPADSADEFAKVHVSPDGTWGVFGNAILSLDRAEKTGTFAGTFCGWE